MSQHSDTVESGAGETSTVVIEGIPVAYETRGEGPPILMVHGWSADRHYLIADLEAAFAAHPDWRRVYLDLPGHGQTPAPNWLSTQDQMLSIVSQFVDSTVSTGPFAVVGNSYGGHLALGLARMMPERITGVALLVPDLPLADGTRSTEEPVVLVEDRSIFSDLAPDEAWIPEALVVHDRRMLDEIRAFDMPAYRLADYEFLDRLNAHYLQPDRLRSPGRA